VSLFGHASRVQGQSADWPTMSRLVVSAERCPCEMLGRAPDACFSCASLADTVDAGHPLFDMQAAAAPMWSGQYAARMTAIA
jgi:hypothetical protein